MDTTGDETYTLVAQDLSTGQCLPDRISGTYYSVEWTNDNQTLFYTVLDAAKRPYQLYRHQLGQVQSQDVRVYQEADAAYRVHLSKTKSRAYLLLQVRSLTSSEVHYLAADQPLAAFRIIQPRQPAMRYTVEHHSRQFFILTNDHAPNFKLMTVSVEAPRKQHWRDVLPHRETVRIGNRGRTGIWYPFLGSSR
jgi:oligopeptidase B